MGFYGTKQGAGDAKGGLGKGCSWCSGLGHWDGAVSKGPSPSFLFHFLPQIHSNI